MAVDNTFKKMVADMVAARRAFIAPKPLPCNHIDCLTYNEFGQCPDCGWLQPLKGDSSSWGNAIREAPLGPSRICLLGLTPEQIDYLKQHDE